MKDFALIGVAGYVAPRHLRAIKETGNNLVAALDRHDNVGILDSYFPDADFFTEFERFDRHLDKLKRRGKPAHYVSICSPNYLHDAHIRFALRQGAHAVCEKPLVLNPWNIDALEQIQNETGKRIYTILQLRLHPAIIDLLHRIRRSPADKTFDIELTYITSRGRWYQHSWKGDVSKSGGVATNIGIHFFDVLTWIFGKPRTNVVNISNAKTASGHLALEKANVRWFLSIDSNTLPEETKRAGKSTYRSIKLENDEIEFSEGFTDLHTASYKHILEGKGFGLQDARESIEIVHLIRNSSPVGVTGEYHPLAAQFR